MALTKSRITGRVPLPTDETLQYAELTFTLSGLDTEGADILPGGIAKRVVLIDSDIPPGVDLWRNTEGLRDTSYNVQARWTVKDRDGTRDKSADLGFIKIGNAANHTLADLLNQYAGPFVSGGVVYPTLADAVAAAIAAANTSTLSATASGSSAARSLSNANAAGAKIFATAAAGVSAVSVNDVFYVPLDPSGGLDIRRKTGASTSVSIGQFLPPTQSRMDSTPGRLMKVSDFGLGGGDTILPQTITLSTELPAVSSIGAAIIPQGSTDVRGMSWPIFMTMARGGGVQAVMAMDSITNSNPSAAIQLQRSDGSGSPWRLLYHEGNVVKPVSQVGGVPTGGIIERGSNANGDFTRFADGTMICWNNLNSDAGADKTWTFPSSFSATPNIQATPVTSAACMAVVGTRTSNSCNFRVYKADGTQIVLGCDLLATGRWF